MKFSIISLVISVFFIASLKAQNRIDSTVKMPDSISKKLVLSFGERPNFLYWIYNNLDVCNLKNPNDYELANGIYIFNIDKCTNNGASLFIYKNESIFIIDCDEVHNPVCFIEKFQKCINELNLSDKEIRDYLLAIGKYLQTHSIDEDTR